MNIKSITSFQIKPVKEGVSFKAIQRGETRRKVYARVNEGTLEIGQIEGTAIYSDSKVFPRREQKTTFLKDIEII